MTTDPGSPDLRVGTVERDAAVAALAVHRDAGRISGQEYEDRWLAATRAQVRSDLAPLFADLPPPHAVGAGPGEVGRADDGDATPSPVVRGAGADYARYLALVPFLALVLFFWSGQWQWFLLIPVAGILFGNARGRRRRS